MSGTTTTPSTGGGNGGVAVNETDRLIASDKVEGTAVYDRNGNRLGSVYNVMIDKYLRAGRLCGDELRRLPWHR